MAQESMSIEERFKRLVIDAWLYSRTHPRVGDDTHKALAQLPAERFVQDVALPMKRHMGFYVGSHLASYEQADHRIWRILSREGFLNLLVVLAGVFTLSAMALYNGASILGLALLLTLLFMFFGAAILGRALMVKRNAIKGIQSTLVKKIFHLDNRDWKVGVVIGCLVDLHSLTHPPEKKLAKSKDIVKGISKFLLQRKGGRKENFLHEFSQRTDEIKTDILFNFFNEIALPVLRSKMKELLEASVRALALLHSLLCSLVSEFARVSTSRESRQIARSFGGIASEVATLANLITSLTLIEARTPSRVVVTGLR